MKLLAELSLMVITALPNSPYPKRFTLIPELTVEAKHSSAYFKLINSARCVPGDWHRWNPVTALWTVEAGFQNGRIKIGIGHQSEHGVDEVQRATESRDYIIFKVLFD